MFYPARELSINVTTIPGRFIASNQNPFRPWADVQPDDNGNIPTVDLVFGGREWVDQVSVDLGVPVRSNDRQPDTVSKFQF